VRETRSLFNYLVPMIQDKQAEEEEENGGQQAELNRPERGQHKGNIGAARWGIEGVTEL
jgi:hypothetical protein